MMMITEDEWPAFMDDLQQTLDKFAVPHPKQDEVKALVESTKEAICRGPVAGRARGHPASARRGILTGKGEGTGNDSSRIAWGLSPHREGRTVLTPVRAASLMRWRA
jgi:hypothetical protein